MLVRIVRMQFQPEKVEDFKKLFKETYPQIRNFAGCRFLQLYIDQTDHTVFYTVSKWENSAMLDVYRQSDLFNKTWAITRSYFLAPPQAYSLDKVVEDSINPF